MNLLSWLNLRFLAVVVLSTARVNAADPQSDKIRVMLTTLNENGQFNGNILVARDGKILYRDAFGTAAGPSGKNQAETPSDLASVSKQFTAMAVMMLAERGRLRYDDPITRYLPQLGDLGASITIRHLLTHTSGIPDVGDLGIDHPNLKESEVVKVVVEQHMKFATPGEEYRYSNTGYILLGMMIEKVAEMSLGDFLARNVFDPLGMTHTQLASKPGYTKGDGGIFSTVDDLLKWDQALYTERLVKQTTLNEAFTPAPVRKGTSTYGFGWNATQKEGDRFVWHTGNTGQYRAFIGRRIGERILVVILTNQGNSRRSEICDAIVDILHEKPFTMPKLSIAMKIIGVIHSRGAEAGVQEYDRLKATQPETFDFSDESELNTLGYQLLGQGEKQAAVRIFELNAREFSSSSNVYDSLGEAYSNVGQKDRAIQAYTKAVELDPKNLNAQRMLGRLK